MTLKTSIYSEYGLKEDFDDKPMELKISKLDVVQKEMPSDQIEEFKKYLEISVDLADAALETTKALVIIDKGNRLQALQGVGNIIKGVLKIVPGAPNQVVEDLKKLEAKIEQLGDKTGDHFAEMKAFITEVKFFLKVVCPTSVLMRCMRDCLKNPSHEAVDNFRMTYKKNPPLKLAYKLISFLDQKSTNPLRMALNAEKGNTKATFEKWENMFIQILDQFLLLEAFGSGLLGTNDNQNRNFLIDKTHALLNRMKEWKEEDDKYWDEIKEFAENVLVNYSHLTDDGKVSLIIHKLNSYITNDSFEVILFNKAEWQEDYTYQCPQKTTQLIEVHNKGDRCVLIYRSKQAHKKSKSEADRLGSQLVSCTNNVLSYNGKFDGTIQKQLIETKKLDPYGFICLVKTTKHVHIRGLDNRWAGRNTVVDVKNTSVGKTYQHYLIASFE